MKRAKGTGTVIKVKRNLHKPYMARITVNSWKDENGKTHEVKKCLGYYKTQKEAQQVLEDYAKNKNTVNLEYNKITFLELWEKWQKEKELDNLSNSTIKGYKFALDKIPDSLKHKTFIHITYDDLQDVINDLKNDGKQYDALRKVKNSISQLYKFAITRNIIQVNQGSLLNIGHSRRKGEPLILNDSELQRLKKIIETEQNPDTKITAQIIYLLCLNGCRISEFLDLKTADVDLKEKIIKIKEAKTEAGDRRIPIHQGALNIYQELYDPENEYFLINQRTNKKFSYANFRDSFFDRFRVLMDWNEEITPHNCRKTFSSLLKRFGVDPTYQKLILGHEGALDLTEKTYTFISNEQLLEAVNKIDLRIVLKQDTP